MRMIRKAELAQRSDEIGHSRRSVVKGAAVAAGGVGASMLLKPGQAIASAPDDWYNVKVDFGAKGDGSTDDTEAISKALAAANSAGGGVVYFPPGTYISGLLTVYSNITILGAGIGATTITLKSGANTDLLHTNEFATLVGKEEEAGPELFAIECLTLDGNKANNSAPSGEQGLLGVCGRSYVVRALHIQNAAGNGWYSEWGKGGGPMEAAISEFKVIDCDGDGVRWYGPHDSVFTGGEIIGSGKAGFRIAKNGEGCVITSVHIWGEQEVGWHIGGGTFLTNCQAEGSKVVNVVLNASDTVVLGGHYFNAPVGIEVGPGEGSYPARCIVKTTLAEHTTTAIKFVKEGGNSRIDVVIRQGAEGDPLSGVYTGQPIWTTDFRYSNVDNSKHPPYMSLGLEATLAWRTGEVTDIELAAVVGSESAQHLALRNGDLHVYTAGRGLRVKEGANAKQGVVSLSGGKALVSNAAVTAESRIMLTAQDDKSTGALRVAAREAGSSFEIASSNGSDSGLVAYEIFEPAT